MSNSVKQRLLERKQKLQQLNESLLSTSIIDDAPRTIPNFTSHIELNIRTKHPNNDPPTFNHSANDKKEIKPVAQTSPPPVEPPKKKARTEFEKTAKSISKSEWTLTERTSKNEEELSSLEALLGAKSTKQKESAKVSDEIHQLLNKPSAKEIALIENFKSDGSTMQEFCRHGTRSDCAKQLGRDGKSCGKLHFRKIIQKHTDMTLGDCSFLNTCFHMDTCKYIHYQVDYSTLPPDKRPASDRGRHPSGGSSKSDVNSVTTPSVGDVVIRKHHLLTDRTVLYPAQWIQCDMRFFDLSVLGKFSVVMADPPWDIHMELPYGTMADDEMRKLNVPVLQDNGFIFLWVTGRAMELARECLKLWGYRMVDEIIWVKTNQLQRIIRTGRTGHWLNHGKEHCLVGLKGPIDKYVGRGLDCDVIVSEVRETSHKPDEIYGIIERLSPGTRKLELFGRQHNAQPNWMTLGNQLDGVHLWDQDVVSRFMDRYPDKNCMPTQQDIISHKQKLQKEMQQGARRQFY